MKTADTMTLPELEQVLWEAFQALTEGAPIDLQDTFVLQPSFGVFCISRALNHGWDYHEHARNYLLLLAEMRGKTLQLIMPGESHDQSS